MSLYSFDDHPEHREQLDSWGKMWIDIALSTEPADREKMPGAIKGLYEAADLTPPPFERIVFVKSPHVAAIVGGIAAAVWWIRQNAEEAGELNLGFGEEVLQRLAAGYAVRFVQRALSKSRGRDTDVTDYAPEIQAALSAAVSGGTPAQQIGEKQSEATLEEFFRGCVQGWSRMHNGGSDWAAWSSYLSFFGEVAKICQDVYQKGVHYVNAARYGASRIMHPEFCIVSDRQSEIHVETVVGQGRLHREDGPARSWADGFEIHSWHGVTVPATFWGWTAQEALRETNSEVRRAAFEYLGWDEAVKALGLEPLDVAVDPGNDGNLLELYSLPESLYDEEVNLLMMVNGSPDRSGDIRRYGETVPAEITTALEAAAWQYSVPVEVYAALERRT